MGNDTRDMSGLYKEIDAALQHAIQIEDKLTALLARIRPAEFDVAAVTYSFAEAATLLRSGRGDQIHVGDHVAAITKTGDWVPFIVIGKDADRLANGEDRPTITVRSERALGFGPFALPDRLHPYGPNSWPECYVRTWMIENVLMTFDEATHDAIALVVKRGIFDGGIHGTIENMFLLSASEVGFAVDDDVVRNEGAPYEYFGYCNSSHTIVETRRELVDNDGETVAWWLRSPAPSNMYYVRYVTPDGSLNYNNANHGYAIAPACVIA